MNKNEALGLPRGSVRAVLAIMLVSAVIGLAFTGKNAPGLDAMAAGAVAWYFAAKRNDVGASGGSPEKAEKPDA